MNSFNDTVVKITTPFLPKGLNNTHPDYYGLLTAVLVGVLSSVLSLGNIYHYYFNLNLELTSFFLALMTVGNLVAITCIKLRVNKFFTVNLACFLAYFAAAGMTLETSGALSPNSLLLLTIPAYGFLLGGRWSSLFWFVMVVGYFLFFESFLAILNLDILTIQLTSEVSVSLFVSNFLGIMVWLLIVLFVFNRGNVLDKREIQTQAEQIENQYEELIESTEEVNAANQQLNYQNNQIIASINYAQRIQASLLPNDDRMRVYLPETFVINKPRDIVSGDFYWFNHLDNKSILIVADCTGHGVPGAFMSIIGYQLLQEIVLMRKVIEPDKILKTLRYRLPLLLKQNTNDNHDGMDMSVVTINHQDQTLQFAGAKSNLTYMKAGKGYILKGDAMTIGGHSLQRKVKHDFKVHTLPLNEIDSFYLFTDGFQDQAGGKDNKRFYRKNILKTLEESKDLSMSEQKKILLERLIAWKGDRPQTDDILFVGVPANKVVKFTTKHKVTFDKEPENLVTLL